jgi:hypothetical protein
MPEDFSCLPFELIFFVCVNSPIVFALLESPEQMSSKEIADRFCAKNNDKTRAPNNTVLFFFI